MKIYRTLGDGVTVVEYDQPDPVPAYVTRFQARVMADDGVVE
jgi:hypothetical protein